jgi:predicted adenylyl cyclase CyaB
MDLKERQERLKINLIDYDLDRMWQAHPFISQLRSRVLLMIPKGLYDSQDLEHQVLFRLTTYDPNDISDDIIQYVIDEQYLVMQSRLEKLNVDLERIFRGLCGKYSDLNVNDRLKLCKEEGKLVARNHQRSFAVEFRVIHDDNIVSLFTNELHYIHQGRPKGETFGFYFAGEEMPWAIETTEPSVIAKEYKREALLAHGVDPNKAIELTRFYTLPGAPLNAISLMDGLVSKHYEGKGIEALFTTTMPMYSKTKSTTIAGGINKVLLVKDLRHKFVKEKVGDRFCYRHTTTLPQQNVGADFLTTHHNFPTMFVVEVFKIINRTSLEPLAILADEKKVIYVRQRESQVEVEAKFTVKDVNTMVEKIIKIGSKFAQTEYIRDIIFGCKDDKRKIRLRIKNSFERSEIEVIYKYKIDSVDNNLKTEVEEIVYKGSRIDEALASIQMKGNFKEENSYEKVRSIYMIDQVELALDIYPYGVWLEIEGRGELIWQVAKKLGFERNDAITSNADELYLEWNKRFKLKEFWDVRFGFLGDK